MRRALVAMLLVLAPEVARAQMMDPRQVSGIPRPDPTVAAGLLTVKVMLGQMGAYAPAGTPVHLVAMGDDGSVKLSTAKVNDEGRAEFPGLATDGKTAYYALAVLGDDRLESQATVLPPKVGVRMILSAHKKGGPSVDDERKAHEGVAEAPALPPAGEVEIKARGRVDASTTAVLRELASGDTREVKLQGSDGMLSGSVTGVATGSDKVYVAEVTAGGHTRRSTPFMLASQAGAIRMVVVYDALLMALQGGAQPDDARMAFELSLTVANLSAAPVDPGPGGLLLPLPAGFRSAKIEDDGSPFTLVPGRGVRYRGPVPPGQLSVTVQFDLVARGGRVSVDMPAPLGMFQSQMAVSKGGRIAIEAASGDLGAPKTRRADDGREYWVLEDFNVVPGTSLRFDIVGLPQPAEWQAWARAIAGALVLVLVVLAVVFAVRPPRGLRGRARRARAGADPRRELRARRERLYAELVALERARAQRRVEGSAFQAQRKAIMTKLILVHRELEELEGPTPGGEPGGRARAG